MMMKRILLLAPASLALMAAAPLAAQDDDTEEVMIEDEGEVPADDMGGMGGMGMLAMFGEMFKVDPLTAEQEARVPAAMSVAEKMMPDGTMAEVMNTMFNQFLEPMFGMAPPPTKRIVSRGLGLYDLEITDEEIAELATVIDPAWEEREQRKKEAFPMLLGKVMTVIEPSIRKGVAESFAVRFDDAELGELDAFFSTPLGAKFARQSYSMATDPRILGKSFEALPQVMGIAEELKSEADQVIADLPQARQFADLSAKEKKRVAELTGYTVEELEDIAAANAYPEAEGMADTAEEAVEY
jgi:hypothetical protein